MASGFIARRGLTASCMKTTASDRSTATTSALVALPVSIDISPKHSPGSMYPRCCREAPSVRTASRRPVKSAPKTSPASSWRMQKSPGSKATALARRMASASASGVKVANSGCD